MRERAGIVRMPDKNGVFARAMKANQTKEETT